MEKPKKTVSGRLIWGIGLVLCLIFAFLLICNLTIIIKGALFPNRPPSVFGVTPMVVLSGSMSGDAEDHIEPGDLIFIAPADPAGLAENDIIAFMDGNMAVTHRIIEVHAGPEWITKGDANDSEDPFPVTEANLIGLYRGRIPGLGDFVLFMQSPAGMILFLGLPLLAYILFDFFRRRKQTGREQQRVDELEAELSRLRELADKIEEND